MSDKGKNVEYTIITSEAVELQLSQCTNLNYKYQQKWKLSNEKNCLFETKEMYSFTRSGKQHSKLYINKTHDLLYKKGEQFIIKRPFTNSVPSPEKTKTN